MEDTNFDPVVEKTQTALKLLDFAFHENTGDDEALNAIRAFRRITRGTLPSILCEGYYGEGSELYREDEWQTIFARQELELSALRAEVISLKKKLNESRRRKSRATETSTKKDDTPSPELSITDIAWEAIRHLVPERYQDDAGRARISAMIVILRTGCGWRVLGTPEKPDGWTTYYNQYNTKWRHETWWIEMMEILGKMES